jgi:hypothetical protein
LGSASSQTGSKSRKNIDYSKPLWSESKVPPVSQLKRSQSLLTQKPDSNNRQKDLFGNEFSSCIQTFKLSPIVCTAFVVEESPEDLRSKSLSDYPKFNGSESPDKTPGSETRNPSTEFIQKPSRYTRHDPFPRHYP